MNLATLIILNVQRFTEICDITASKTIHVFKFEGKGHLRREKYWLEKCNLANSSILIWTHHKPRKRYCLNGKDYLKYAVSIAGISTAYALIKVL